ncbi:hypothetical protein MBLNU230_g0006t1 [Neophaeotheca triangularis]
MANIRPETAILKPRDPALDLDTDAWPEFILKDAEVYPQESEANGESISLLLASEHNPLTLTGRVAAPTAKTRSLYLNAGSIPKQGQRVVVESVKSFAYGQYPDGSIALWAAGKAGWFLLKPSRAYKPRFTEMTQAIEALYWLADHYREDGNSDPDTETVYAELGRFASDNENLTDSVWAQVGRDMLVPHREFLLASMIGKKEGIEWAEKQLFREWCKRFPNELATVKERAFGKPVAKKGNKASQSWQGSIDSAGSLKRKRGRPPKASGDVGVDSSSTGRQNPVESVEKPKKGMPPPPSRGSRQPQGSRASSRLSATAQGPEGPTTEPTRTTTPSQDDSEDEHARHAQKGKSALRLKPAKASKGTSGKGGKAPVSDNQEDGSDNDSDELVLNSPSLANAKKRKTSASPPNPSNPDDSSSSDEGIDIPSSPSSSAHAADTARSASATTRLPNDPVQENTYTCPLDGCNHKVYLASEPASQKLIREHFALHAYDDDRRVQLVKRLALPGMGSGYLMQRVKERVAKEGFVGSFENGGGGGEDGANGFGQARGATGRY